MDERLAIFDEQFNRLGEALREEVHLKGYWHEVFHCWVLEKVKNEWHIYLQLRSHYKKDYPGQFDITAAGHLLATETVIDGVRELNEELGLNVAMTELHSLDIIPYAIINEQIKDNEFAHVFVYQIKNGMEQFQIQRAELDGIYQMKLQQFFDLVMGVTEQVVVTGYYYEQDEKIYHCKNIGLDAMQALPQSYLQPLIGRLQNFVK